TAGASEEKNEIADQVECGKDLRKCCATFSIISSSLTGSCLHRTPGLMEMRSDRRLPAARFCGPWGSKLTSCCMTVFREFIVHCPLRIRCCRPTASAGITKRQLF